MPPRPATPLLVLASASPQRRRLLAEAGFEFVVDAPEDHVERGLCSQCGPAELVVELAVAKAAHVVARRAILPPAAMNDASRGAPAGTLAVILACDTVAECGGEILGKPRDEEHARAMLRRLQGSIHRVYSGVCAWTIGPTPPREGEAPAEPAPDASFRLGRSLALPPDAPPPYVVRLAISELEMAPLSGGAIDDYLATGLWREKAGAFGLQDRPDWLRLRSGSESNVVGLPMETVVPLLEKLGVAPSRSDPMTDATGKNGA